MVEVDITSSSAECSDFGSTEQKPSLLAGGSGRRLVTATEEREAYRGLEATDGVGMPGTRLGAQEAIVNQLRSCCT